MTQEEIAALAALLEAGLARATAPYIAAVEETTVAVKQLRNEVVNLRTEVLGVRTDLSHLSIRIGEVESRLARFESRFDTLRDDIMTGRSADTDRIGKLERRLDALEAIVRQPQLPLPPGP